MASRFPAALVLLVVSLLPSMAGAQDVLRLPPPPDLFEAPPSPAPDPVAPEVVPPEVVETPEPTEETLLLEAPDVEIAPEAAWYSPSYWFGPTPWDTGFELGLNGASGTSDTLSTRVGGYVKRKTDRGKLDASLYHNRTKSDGQETQNNMLLDARYDWLFDCSCWTLYLMNQTFHDEFSAFDVNVNWNSGFGYQVYDTDFLKLGTSFGLGAAKKFGGPRHDWVPEFQAGAKWEQQVSKTQKFVAKFDFFPEWEDFNSYRLVTDIGWQVQLSVPSNTSLKISLTDRFDSQSDGYNPHNTNYSVLMLWKR